MQNPHDADSYQGPNTSVSHQDPDYHQKDHGFPNQGGCYPRPSQTLVDELPLWDPFTGKYLPPVQRSSVVEGGGHQVPSSNLRNAFPYTSPESSQTSTSPLTSRSHNQALPASSRSPPLQQAASEFEPQSRYTGEIMNPEQRFTFCNATVDPNKFVEPPHNKPGDIFRQHHPCNEETVKTYHGGVGIESITHRRAQGLTFEQYQEYKRQQRGRANNAQ